MFYTITKGHGQNKMKEIFTQYYLNNSWLDPESVSGPGSTIEHTIHLQKAIREIIEKYDIKSILDAPCGDYNWFRLIDRNITYIGGDIVEPLIKKNQLLYTNKNTTFRQLDITKDKLPEVDLMLCRDCWPHFSNEDIFKSIDVFLNSNIKYLLTTNCGFRENLDIETGKFRFLNLYMSPFSFDYPLEVIPEWTWKENPPKTLVLFNKKAIKHE